MGITNRPKKARKWRRVSESKALKYFEAHVREKAQRFGILEKDMDPNAVLSVNVERLRDKFRIIVEVAPRERDVPSDAHRVTLHEDGSIRHEYDVYSKSKGMHLFSEDENFFEDEDHLDRHIDWLKEKRGRYKRSDPRWSDVDDEIDTFLFVKHLVSVLKQHKAEQAKK